MSLFKKSGETEAEQKLSMDEKAAQMAQEPDEESKIAKKLKAMPKWRYWAIAILAVAMTVFQLYIKLGKPMQPWAQIPLHLCFSMWIVFLFNPMVEKVKNQDNKLKNLWWIYDGALYIAIGIICWYFLTNANALNLRVYNVDKMTSLQIFVAVLLLWCVMEAVRRVVSLALFAVLIFFMAYAFFGQHISGIFRFAGMTFPQFCETLMLGQNGIFGSPLSTSLNTLFYFMVFGAFFSNCGGGSVLIDMGMKLSDKTAGGPAKAAVISSGLLGMISGSAVANVSTTGVLTIPLMKKAGYTPEEAAARELWEETGLTLKEIKDRIDGGYSAIGFSNELTVCFIGVGTGEFRESTSAEEEIEAGWYTKAEVRDLLKTAKFAARTQAYCYAWSRE